MAARRRRRRRARRPRRAGRARRRGTRSASTAGDLDGFLVVALPAPRARPGDARRARPARVRRARRRHRPAARRARTRSPAPCSPTSRCASRSAPATRCGSPRPSRGSAAGPADPRSVEEHEELVYPLLDPASGAPPRRAARGPRPRPARRAADPPAAQRDGQVGRLPHRLRPPRARLRRQRPPARPGGRARRCSRDGLLAEKPSVGQRHVFLNPRRAADIHRLIETGDAPPGLKLPVRMRYCPRMKPPSPGQVAGKLQTVATLAGVGIIRPQRPDRLVDAAVALHPLGRDARPPATRPPRRATPTSSR